MTNFIPHTTEERQQMLEAIGVPSVKDLFHNVPDALKTSYTASDSALNKQTLEHLPTTGLSELELQQHLVKAAAENQGAQMESFLGGGAYARFIPPAVNTIASRSEFYTAYTPYQPEMSQGTLQMIYEFQTMLCELTGMDVTNASVYDGAAALSEAAMMTIRSTRRKVVYYANTLNPHYIQVLQTYVKYLGGVTLHAFDPHQPFPTIDNPAAVAGILIQQPDYFGSLLSLTEVEAFCKAHGSLLVVSVDPISLGLIAPPREFGADIVCGDIQQFGNPVNYGGPYGGFLSTTEKLMRQLPGRVVGRSLDKNGEIAYTLTLQTREQHIRREKATSNICTNQSLNVLKATVYLSLVGPEGLKQVATLSAQKAHILSQGLLNIPNVSLRFEQPFISEFALRLPVTAKMIIEQMASQHDILAGIDLGRYFPEESHTLLVAVTEMNSDAAIKHYIDALRSILEKSHGLSVLQPLRPKESQSLATGTSGRVCV